MHRSRILFVVALAVVPAAAWPQGNPVGPEFRVNGYTTSYQILPSVAADPFGNFVVVWGSWQDGSATGVFGQRYAGSGIPLGPEFRVNTFTAGFQTNPSVAADASGNFVVVWESNGQDGSNYGVFGQRYASSGVPLGPEFRVNTYTTNNQRNPSVAADPVGNFVMVWSSYTQDGVQDGVFGQRYASSGTPLGPEFRVNTWIFGNQTRPAVAADPSGRFVVVWDGPSPVLGGSDFIFGQRYASTGVPLGPEFRVSTYAPYYSYNRKRLGSVATDSSGNFMVVWASDNQDGSSWAVYGQRFASAGFPLGSEFRVNTHTASEQSHPSMAADSAGNFVVAWEDSGQDGFSFGVFGQRYASSGAPVGPEFRVNTYTTGQQRNASVAADPSGNFVVVWQSQEDGDSYGIFGQRYNMIVPVELMHFRVE
jgi:hypothetical protein